MARARRTRKPRLAGMDSSVKTLDQLLKALYEIPSYRTMLRDMYVFAAVTASGIDTTRRPKDIAERCFNIAEAIMQERARRN
jgi:hypothetical protein